MIEKGAPNEVFTILKWHLEIRIHDLIDYIASLSICDAFESTTANVTEIHEFNTSHEIKSEVVNKMEESRKVQPLLVVCIQNEFWVIDGNHRLQKKTQDGDTECEFILVPNELLYRFCQPFMKGSSNRRGKKQMENIGAILGLS